jgi:hypothetical protein
MTDGGSWLLALGFMSVVDRFFTLSACRQLEIMHRQPQAKS